MKGQAGTGHDPVRSGLPVKCSASWLTLENFPLRLWKLNFLQYSCTNSTFFVAITGTQPNLCKTLWTWKKKTFYTWFVHSSFFPGLPSAMHFYAHWNVLGTFTSSTCLIGQTTTMSLPISWLHYFLEGARCHEFPLIDVKKGIQPPVRKKCSLPLEIVWGGPKNTFVAMKNALNNGGQTSPTWILVFDLCCHVSHASCRDTVPVIFVMFD